MTEISQLTWQWQHKAADSPCLPLSKALVVEMWLYRNHPVSVCNKSCPSVSMSVQKCWWPSAAHPVTAHTVLPFFIKIKNPIDFYFSCFRYQLLLTTATAVPYQYLMSRVRWNGEALWVSPSKWSLWGLRFCGLCLFSLCFTQLVQVLKDSGEDGGKGSGNCFKAYNHSV